MKRRHLFADVKNFLLYDFFTPEGYVNEDVFAYSNRAGEERALVIYHNRYTSSRGWIRTSVAYSVGEGDERRLILRELGEGLQLYDDPNYFCIFKDEVTGLEYIRNSKELCEKGLYVELGAYQYHVFLDFREIQDSQWHHYGQLNQLLNGRGVPNLGEVFKEILLPPVHHAFKELVNANMFRRLMEARISKSGEPLDNSLIDEVEQKTIHFFDQAKGLSNGREDGTVVAREIKHKLEAILYLPVITSRFQVLQPKGVKAAAEYLHKKLTDAPSVWGPIFSWLFVHPAGKVVSPKDFPEQSHKWIGEWRLDQIIAETLTDLGVEEGAARRSVTLIKPLTRHQRWFKGETVYQITENLLKDPEVQQFLMVNRYDDILWFNKEAFEEMLWWLMLTAALEVSFDPLRPAKEVVRGLERCWSVIQKLQEAEKKSKYQVEKLLEVVTGL
jgi:hypothetical protein